VGRAWQESLFNLIKRQGYKQSLKEPCLWFKHKNNLMTVIDTYVDDILIAGSDQQDIENISKMMGETFRMKNLRELKEFLGITALKTENGIKLTEGNYTKAILKKFRKENCKPVKAPMTKTYTEDKAEVQEQYPIRQALGLPMYLVNATRHKTDKIIMDS
jgi:hypothetical protein